MKATILTALLLSGCTLTEDAYFKVGAGYKFAESDVMWNDASATHPISSRLELGKRAGNIRYGVAHKSQWFTGWPFDNAMEYQCTELFVDYTFELGE